MVYLSPLSVELFSACFHCSTPQVVCAHFVLDYCQIVHIYRAEFIIQGINYCQYWLHYLSQWPIFNWLQMREQRFLISRNVLLLIINSLPNYVSTCQLARSESRNPGRWHVFKYTSHTCVLSHINTHMHGLTNLHWCIKNKYSR